MHSMIPSYRAGLILVVGINLRVRLLFGRVLRRVLDLVRRDLLHEGRPHLLFVVRIMNL